VNDLSFSELCLQSTGCVTPGEHLMRASGVERYHNEPGVPSQLLGQHTWRVMAILLTVWPDSSRNLMYATQFHDAPGEGLTGDIPAPIKWGDKLLKEKIDAMDSMYAHEVVGILEVDLEPFEVARMKCADYLELADYCSNYYTPAANRIMKLGLKAVISYGASLPAADAKAMARYMKSCVPKWVDSLIGRSGAKQFSSDIHDAISELNSRG